jgi:hypothetical protein
MFFFLFSFFLNSGKGGNRARLVSLPAYSNGASSSSPSSYTNNDYTNQLTPPGIDETLLELQLVSYIYKNGTRENPVTVPELGEYCKKDLGFSMKGYLTRFLMTRRQIFCLPDDGRQHVLLQTGAAEALGVIGQLPHLPEDLLGSAGELQFHQNQEENVESYPQRPVEYSKWDRITQEMYDLAVSRGGSVLYKEVDVYIKARCAAEIASSGISIENWQAQKHSWKRRNVFKKEGNYLVVHYGLAIPNGKRGNSSNLAGNGAVSGGGGSGRAAENGESFPPLSFSAEQFVPKSAATTASTNGVYTTESNETLQAFIRERKALESLQLEVQASLARMASFTELEKENDGLRAACVTLGRELLAVKDEILDMKMQLAEHGINLSNTVNLNSPDANGGLLDEIFLPADLL